MTAQGPRCDVCLELIDDEDAFGEHDLWRRFSGEIGSAFVAEEWHHTICAVPVHRGRCAVVHRLEHNVSPETAERMRERRRQRRAVEGRALVASVLAGRDAS